MKKFILPLAFVVLSSSSWAVVDTLRHYDPSASLTNYNSTQYPFQVARFDPVGPGDIVSILVTLSGNAGGTARLHLLGHEAGTSFPQLEQDLISPIQLTKTTSGDEKIKVDLSPPEYLDNNQFFIAIDDFNGTQLRYDGVIYTPPCQSGSGGDYYYQFMKNAANQWVYGTSAFAIDVVMDYNSMTSPSYFKDVTAQAGISETLSNATIACNDYDGDGYLDILVAGRLYQNNQDGTFSDVTASKGLQVSGTPVGNAIVDMNNDGAMDILLLDASDSSFIFLNDNGEFVRRYYSSLPIFKALNSFSLADINYDGYPDLFVCQLWSTYPESEPNYLFYFNEFTGFEDKTTLLYPEYDGTWNFPNAGWDPPNFIVDRNRNSRGSYWVDFDNDGDLDLFITNYFLHQDEFLRNDGNGSFTDICVAKGIDRNATGSNHGTGVDWADYDNDGDMDLLLSQFAHPNFMLQFDHRGTTIYRNDGWPDYDFTDLTGTHGIQYEETHAGGSWGDVNGDGLVDLITTTYYGCRYIDLYLQKPDNTFEMRSFEYGIDKIVTGQDAVWADYDNDGKLDLLCGENGQFRLFRNVGPSSNNYVAIELISTTANKSGIGARVSLLVNGQQYVQEVNAGRGQRMQKPLRLYFGIGNNTTADNITVSWPDEDYTSETITPVIVNTTNVIKQGVGNLTAIEGDIAAAEPRVTVYPNPFSEVVLIKYELLNKQNVSLEVFSLLGQRVATLVDAVQAPGQYSIQWDGRDDLGYSLPAGIYLYTLRTSNSSSSEKVVFLGSI